MNINKQRNRLDNSLIYSAIAEIEETNRIKTVFRQEEVSDFSSGKVGKVFMNFNINHVMKNMYYSARPLADTSFITDVKSIM